MITSSSRYANSPVALLNTARGPILTIVPGQPRPKVFNYSYVSVGEGERLDHMAYHTYGDETLWWVIADANPEILDWTDIPVGTVLRVPSAN